jgi:hypothetical protein
LLKLCQTQIKFQPLVLSKPMQVISLTARAQEELTKLKLPSECAAALHFGALPSGYPLFGTRPGALPVAVIAVALRG